LYYRITQPKHNGYKVYWQDGGQIVPLQKMVEVIINTIEKTELNQRFEANEDLIHGGARNAESHTINVRKQ
jgi:phosphomannomutase